MGKAITKAKEIAAETKNTTAASAAGIERAWQHACAASDFLNRRTDFWRTGSEMQNLLCRQHP